MKDKRCLWCINPNADDSDVTPHTHLCWSHLAEYEGLSLDELLRMEDEQSAEYADTFG